jgi:N-acetylglutamate synthase-like GNAT family acetyltransferase
MRDTTDIRHATLADIGAMAALITQLGYPVEAEGLPLRLQRLSAGRGVVLLATQGGRVVGLATAHVLSVINRDRDVCWLTAMVVDDTMRRAGIGRALVAAVESHARAQGCEWLSVTTHVRRAEAQGLLSRYRHGADGSALRQGPGLSLRLDGRGAIPLAGEHGRAEKGK